MIELKGEDVKKYLEEGGKYAWNLLMSIYGDSLNQTGEEAFLNKLSTFRVEDCIIN